MSEPKKVDLARGWMALEKMVVPDGLDWINGVLSEVKNVQYQALTNQIKDFIAYSRLNLLQFNLYVAGNVSAPLQEQEDLGHVNIIKLVCE
jgi:Restriction endonuclease fold toxin 7